MAWQTPTHTCGHDGQRYQAYGKQADRAYKLRQVESQPCPDCRKAEADKVAAEAGLVPLRGTAKQVAWASDIRERALRLSASE